MKPSRLSPVNLTLGKGEIVSSILTGSTRKSPINKGLLHTREKRARQNHAEQSTNSTRQNAPNQHQAFGRRSRYESVMKHGHHIPKKKRPTMARRVLATKMVGEFRGLASDCRRRPGPSGSSLACPTTNQRT